MTRFLMRLVYLFFSVLLPFVAMTIVALRLDYNFSTFYMFLIASPLLLVFGILKFWTLVQYNELKFTEDYFNQLLVMCVLIATFIAQNGIIIMFGFGIIGAISLGDFAPFILVGLDTILTFGAIFIDIEERPIL